MPLLPEPVVSAPPAVHPLTVPNTAVALPVATSATPIEPVGFGVPEVTPVLTVDPFLVDDEDVLDSTGGRLVDTVDRDPERRETVFLLRLKVVELLRSPEVDASL
jgi:hypothetical protein